MRILQMNEAMTYDEFYKTYYHSVLKYLRGKCANYADAEDLTSQVFIYCYQNFSKYDPQKASITSWVYMIANSRFKNYCRDRKVYADIDEIGQFIPDENNSLEAAIELDEMREEIARALLKLSDVQRMVVVLSYFKNMSAAEIGEMLDMKPGAVRTCLSRALDKMESDLEDFR